MKTLTFFFICFISSNIQAFDFSNFGFNNATNNSYNNMGSGNTVNEGSISIDNNVVSGTSHSGVKGSGRVISEQRTLGQFNKLMTNVVADLTIVSSNKYRLNITGDDNIIGEIVTKVINNQLQIFSKVNYSTKNPIYILIEMPELQEVKQAGYGNIQLENVTKEHLAIQLSGSGNVSAKGTVKTLNATIEGTGSLNLQALKTHSASVSIVGMGSAFVDVTAKLEGKIKGMGDIIYSGQPSVSRSIQGMGRIVHK